MEIKLLEIRDVATRIAVMAISTQPANQQQRALIRSAGYSDNYRDVLVIDLHSCEGSYDPFKQRSDTRRLAHEWIRERFATLKDGDVVDVEFITGKVATPKVSEVQGLY